MSATAAVSRSVRPSVTGPMAEAEQPWSPLGLANLIQFATSPLGYRSDAVNARPVLNSSELHGTHRQPRQGRCWLFDGVNDYARRVSRITSGSPTQLTAACWVKFPPEGSTLRVFGGEYTTVPFTSRSWLFGDVDLAGLGTNGKLTVWLSSDNGTVNFKAYSGATSIDTNTWTHVAFTFNAGVLKLYVNGAEEVTTKHIDGPVPSLFNSTTQFSIGAINAGANFWFNSLLRDFRVYTTAKSAAEIVAIRGGATDTDSLTAQYPCSEEAGDIGYDVSSNARHLSHMNTTSATFHAVDTGIPSNPNNSIGYRLSSTVYIPRRLDAEVAADGNALTVAGKSPMPIASEVPCLTFDGVDDVAANAAPTGVPSAGAARTISAWAKITSPGGVIMSLHTALGQKFVFQCFRFGSLWYLFTDGVNVGNNQSFPLATLDPIIGQWAHIAISQNSNSFVIYLNNTVLRSGTFPVAINTGASPTVYVGNRLDVAQPFTGSLQDVRLFSVAKTAAEIQAISQGLVDPVGLVAHYPMQDGAGATARDVGPNANHLTLTNFNLTGAWANRSTIARDWCIQHGGNVSAGVFVPGLPASANDAGGNPKLIQSGTHGNPHSRLVRNPFSAAELSAIGAESSDLLAPQQLDQLEATTNTKFTDGSTKYFAASEPLVGADLIEAEAYLL